MIRARTNRVLAALALSTATLLWTLNRLQPVDSLAPQARPLMAFHVEDVDYLLIEKTDLRLECRRIDNAWWLTSPLRARADAARVHALLDRLATARILDTIHHGDLDQRDLTLGDYGLETPRARLVVGTSAQRLEMLAGRDAPAEASVYLSLPPSPDLYVVEAGMLEVLPRELSALRDHRLLVGDPRRVVQLDMRRPGTPFVQLSRDIRHWRLTQPLESRADPETIQRLLRHLFDVRVNRFLWPSDDQAATSDMALRERLMVYGLDREEQVLTLQLRESGQTLGAELRVSLQRFADTETVIAYAAASGVLAAIDASWLDAFNLPLDQLRDRQVLRLMPDDVRRIRLSGPEHAVTLERDSPEVRWRLTAPVADIADQQTVEQFLGGMIAMRADGFVDDQARLATPTQNVSRLELSGPELQRTLSVWPLADGDAWVARVEGRGDGYQLSPERLPALLRAPSGATAFRDKTILSLDPGALRRLTRRTADGEHLVLEPGPDGRWSANVALPALPDMAAIDDVRFALAHLRAADVVSLSARELEPYGLHAPRIEWTAEQAGERTSRMTLLIGDSTPAGGNYAVVRGRNVVFVIDPETAETLRKPLVLRPEPNG